LSLSLSSKENEEDHREERGGYREGEGGTEVRRKQTRGKEMKKKACGPKWEP
jgi:hypothetical protein